LPKTPGNAQRGQRFQKQLAAAWEQRAQLRQALVRVRSILRSGVALLDLAAHARRLVIGEHSE
jgi:NAD dependent epimerase/dehydratase family enzyme